MKREWQSLRGVRWEKLKDVIRSQNSERSNWQLLVMCWSPLLFQTQNSHVQRWVRDISKGHSLVAGCCPYNWLKSELGRTDEIQNIARSNKLHFLPCSHPYPPLNCQLVRWSVCQASLLIGSQLSAPLGVPTPLSLLHLFLQNENTNSRMRNIARNCSSKFDGV